MRKGMKLTSCIFTLAVVCALMFGLQITAQAEVKKGSCGIGVNWELDTETGVARVYGQGAMNDFKSSPIGQYASKVKMIVIESGVTHVGNYMFRDCNNLKEVIIEEGVESIGEHAFAACEYLEKVSLPDSVQVIGERAFAGCHRLQDVYLPKNIHTIGEEAFMTCKNLTTVVIPDGAVSIGYGAFYECYNLKHIVIPQSVETIGGYAFWNCTSLITAQLPNDLEVIPDALFFQCKSLVSVNIPEAAKSIGRSAFSHTKMRSVVLPEGLEKIGDFAFDNCALEQIIIPKSVTSIGNCAFQNAKSLTKIAVLNKDTTIYNSRSVMGIVGDVTLYGHPSSTTLSYAMKYGHAFEYITDSNLWVDVMSEWDPFDDVPQGKYYYEPVKWAVKNGITSGNTATLFAPNDPCTRGQIVTFLWRTLGKPTAENSKNPFRDVAEGKYYYDAVLWAVENGITSGLTAAEFGPNEACTRGQIVTFLWRAMGKPDANGAKNIFTDVPNDKYYAKAVLWAVENGITSGLTATEFGPNNACTRGQIVTFLYRAFN